MAAVSLDFVHVIENSRGNTDNQHLKLSPGLVLYSARNVNHYASVNFDFLVVEPHSALAIDNVVKLVGSLVVMELRIGNLDLTDFTCCAILALDE